jgi:S-phase kinase-associated protein 1
MGVTLLSSSGDTFDASTYHCMHCKTIANYIDEEPDVDVIPVPLVNSKVLATFMEFFSTRLGIAREIAAEPDLDSESTLTDEQRERLRHRAMAFFDGDEMPDLLEYLLGANYLNSDAILDAIASVISSRISGKTRDEMREILGIESDFTPEEEEKIIAEHSWAF